MLARDSVSPLCAALSTGLRAGKAPSQGSLTLCWARLPPLQFTPNTCHVGASSNRCKLRVSPLRSSGRVLPLHSPDHSHAQATPTQAPALLTTKQAWGSPCFTQNPIHTSIPQSPSPAPAVLWTVVDCAHTTPKSCGRWLSRWLRWPARWPRPRQRLTCGLIPSKCWWPTRPPLSALRLASRPSVSGCALRPSLKPLAGTPTSCFLRRGRPQGLSMP